MKKIAFVNDLPKYEEAEDKRKKYWILSMNLKFKERLNENANN